MKRPFIFATGGTGGHIFPAVSIADSMSDDVIFAGHGLHANEYIIEGMHEVHSIMSAEPKSIRGIVTLIRGFFIARRFLAKVNPQAVVGFGSYHSFPVVLAALSKNIPILLYEPNAVMGKVNAFFSKHAHAVLTQFPIAAHGYVTKVPLRASKKIPKEEAKSGYGFTATRPVVLVMGGSQGARIFESLSFPPDVQVLHLAGKHSDCDALKRKYELEGVDARVLPFEQEMHKAWSAADVAVCRSGAATIAEHLHYGVPTLFIPFPYASGNHQLHNANYVATQLGTALLLKESDISSFQEMFAKLLSKKAIFPSHGKAIPVHECLQRYHFIGAGGIGMSALIHILRDKGIPVSGSDMKRSKISHVLEEKGVQLSFPQQESNLPSFARVVYSTAIQKENPEFAKARKKSLPLFHRSELLAVLCEEKETLLVAGTHGKTSTSALLAYSLKEAGYDPMYAVGGILKNYEKNGAWGKGVFAAVEADESDGSFLRLPCHSAILTNIEYDHLDYYGSKEKMVLAYKQFIANVKHHLVWCADDPMLRSINPHGVSYGFCEDADVRIIQESDDQFALEWENGDKTSFTCPFQGDHFLLNSVGVLVLCTLLGFDVEQITKTWGSYKGVKRRLEHVAHAMGIDFYDDYAHHPTEVSATLHALRKTMGTRRLVAVLQPHRYSRLQEVHEDFPKALEEADIAVITDVYAAGEKPIPGVDHQLIVSKLRAGFYLPRNELSEKLLFSLQEGDVVVFLGAGDITSVSQEIRTMLHHEETTSTL